MKMVAACLGLVSAMVAMGCDEEKAEPPEAVEAAAKKPAAAKPIVEVPYKVTKDELMKPFKRTVEVELDARITEKDLNAIATEVMAASQIEVERTFIGYRLKGQPKESAYWATTHHNPNLEVRVQGLSKKDYKQLMSLKVPAKYGEVLGEWLYEDVAISTLNVVYRKGGKLFAVRLTKAGEELSNNELVIQKTGGDMRYAEKDNVHGEYFTLSEAGEMAYWGEPLEGIEPKPFHRAPPRGKPNLNSLRR